MSQSSDPSSEPAPELLSGEMIFHYREAQGFRHLAPMGIRLDYAANGTVTLSFFNERRPVPTMVKQQVKSGQLVRGGELEREGLDGILRDIECGVTLDLELAEVLLAELDAAVVALRSARESMLKGGSND